MTASHQRRHFQVHSGDGARAMMRYKGGGGRLVHSTLRCRGAVQYPGCGWTVQVHSTNSMQRLPLVCIVAGTAGAVLRRNTTYIERLNDWLMSPLRKTDWFINHGSVVTSLKNN